MREASEDTPAADQVAVIPYRWDGERLEVSLITAIRSGRWGIPKGFIDVGETARESAAKEAREEAGLAGRIGSNPVGRYRYAKWGATFTVDVYLMEVSADDESWDEAELRARCWAPADEALQLVEHHPAHAIIAQAIRELRAARP